MIDMIQLRNAGQITAARIGQPILAFGIMQAILQSAVETPALFPILWSASHTLFVFFMGLIISAQNHAIQSEGIRRTQIFAFLSQRIFLLAGVAAILYSTVAFAIMQDTTWTLLIFLYVVSSALNAIHNTLHELLGKRNRSIWVNWQWITALILVLVFLDAVPWAPPKAIAAVIVVRIMVISLSLFHVLRGVPRSAEGASARERISHGAEFGLNMAVETSAFPILMSAALLLGGAASTQAIYAFSVEANFLFIAMTGVFQQATLNLGEKLRELRTEGNGTQYLSKMIVHVGASAVLVLGLGTLVLAWISSTTEPLYWLMVFSAVLVMSFQTLAVSWARVLDLTRAITLSALPSTFVVFVGSTLLFLWLGFEPRLSITLGVALDGILVSLFLYWLVSVSLNSAESQKGIKPAKY